MPLAMKRKLGKLKHWGQVCKLFVMSFNCSVFQVSFLKTQCQKYHLDGQRELDVAEFAPTNCKSF